MIRRISCSSSKLRSAPGRAGAAGALWWEGAGTPPQMPQTPPQAQRSGFQGRGHQLPTIRRRSTTMMRRSGRADGSQDGIGRSTKPASLPATEPEPTEAEQAEIRDLAKRKKARRQAPRFAVQRQEGSQSRCRRPVSTPTRRAPD